MHTIGLVFLLNGYTLHAAVDRLYSASLFCLGRALGNWVVHLVITWDTEVHIRVCYHACMHCIHGLSMLPGFIV